MFVAAEGRNRTERNYLKGFMAEHENIVLRMVPQSATDPEGMAGNLASFMKEAGYSPEDGDLAFCLVDHDCNAGKDAQIQKALKIARKHGFELVVSNPCFELWFLCHFTAAPRNCSSSKDTVKEVMRYLPQYAKGDENLYENTKSHLPDAVINAKMLEKRCLSRGLEEYRHDFHPSTAMYRMIEKMSAR